jgi:hypothetical protein
VFDFYDHDFRRRLSFITNGAIGGIVAGAVFGVLLVMTNILALFVLRSRKPKSVPSEVVGAPQFNGPVVLKTACDIPELRHDIEGIVSDERVSLVSGRLKSDGLHINSEII